MPSQSRWVLLAGLLLAASHPLIAQLEPRDSPAEYPLTCQTAAAAFGVEYLSRSLPTPRGLQIVPNVLIFEIGVFPKAGQTLRLGSPNFELTWKKRKPGIVPISPQIVVAALRNPFWDYDQDVQIVASAGTVNRRGDFEGVTIGGPPNRPRFPGDTSSHPEHAPPAPDSPTTPDTPKTEPPHPDELPDRTVLRHALPTRTITKPTAGYIYFDYRGKLKKLKNLRLSIHLPEQKCELLLRR